MASHTRSTDEPPTRSSSDDAPDTFDQLLRAAVCPPDPSEPLIAQHESFERLPVGARISDRFVVEWCVGKGGMGDVYRCQDQETNSTAALKVIRRVDDKSRFRREASILAALSHDAIVRYLAHGATESGTPYLAMEWLEGEDLAKLLDRGSLSIADTITLGRWVCSGLALAHRHGFVHRDIKPSNLFLCQGQIERGKLIDFGIAHRGVTTQTATRVGTLLGTVGYMAPEQASGAGIPDARDDLFSLGCVLFECLAGRPAFFGDSAAAVLDAVLRTEPVDVRALRPETPDDLAELILHLLRKDRGHRPRDAAAVSRILEQIDVGGRRRQERVVLNLECEEKPTFATVIRVCSAATSGIPSGSARETVENLAVRYAWHLERHDAAQFYVFRTSNDLTLVDIAEQAVTSARTIHELPLESEVHVRSYPENTSGVGIEHLHGRLYSRDITTIAGLNIDPVILALHAARYENAEPAAIAAEGFIGREAELTVLHAVFNECIDEEIARAVLALAPSGYGKSRLMAEFIAQLPASSKVNVLCARARHAEQRQSSSLWRTLAGDEPRTRDVLKAMTASSALAICIDDAQWADLETMQFLASSFATLTDRPLFIAGFCRPGMSEDRRAVWQALCAHELRLRPLGERSLNEYLRSLRVGVPDAQDFGLEIAVSGGNPRLLRALVAARGSSSGAVFETAVALFTDRILQMTSRARNALCGASIFSSMIEPSSMGRLFDDPEGARRELAMLCEQGLLIEQRSDIDHAVSYRFAHPVVREAAQRCLSRADLVRAQHRLASGSG